MSSRRLHLAGDRPLELVVYDEATNCPYLPHETARLPMRLPARPLSRGEFAERLAVGDRRQGLVLYRPSCPDCQACEAIRIELDQYRLSKSQRRVLKKGNQALRVELGPPTLSDRRVELYNLHKHHRNLVGDGDPIDRAGYQAFLVDSCTESFELRYYCDDLLIGLAVVDRAEDSLSAVYTYFDPAFDRYSIGTYSILKQLEMCKRWGLRYLYLGLYVHGSSTMNYKTRFLPHQRLVAGQWLEFDQPEHPTSDVLVRISPNADPKPRRLPIVKHSSSSSS